MVKIYYTVFEKPVPDELFCKYLNRLPDFMKKDIIKYKRWEDRQASLFGKLLLKNGMAEMSVSGALDEIKLSAYGRPFINDSFDFSISHTPGCVMCALSKTGKIGVDVEAVKGLALSAFENFFSEAEWSDIIHAAEPIDRFYHFWTRKESVIKADGRGLSVPLSDFEVTGDSVVLTENTWHITALEVKNEKYKAHLASSERQHSEIIPVSFPDFMDVF